MRGDRMGGRDPPRTNSPFALDNHRTRDYALKINQLRQGFKAMKELVHYSKEVCDVIIARLKTGEALTSICSTPDLPTRAAFYEWLEIYPELRSQYQAACRIKARIYRDEIEEWSDPSKIETIIKDSFGSKTHSANVAAHQLGCQWRKHLMTMHNPKEFADDQPIKFEFDINAEPEEQVNQVMGQLAAGTITLKQAASICDIIYKRIDLLELPKLIEIVKRHEAMLSGDGQLVTKFGALEAKSDKVVEEKDGQ